MSMTLSMLIKAKDLASQPMKKLSGSVRASSKESKKLSDTVKKTGYNFNIFSKGGKNAGNALDRLGKKATHTEKTVGRLKKSLIGLFAGGALALGANQLMNALSAPMVTTMNYGSAIDKVAAIAGVKKGSEDYIKLDSQAKHLGANTAFSATEVAQGQQYLAMAGFNTSETTAAMPGLLDLAKAGDTELATTSDISSNILSSFKMDASEMNRLGDVLASTFTTSNSTLTSLGETISYAGASINAFGGNIEEAAAMAGKLHDIGIQGSRAGTALNAIYSRMAAAPKMAQDAMSQIGLNIKKANGELKSMPEILKEVAAKTKHMDKDQQMAIAKQIAGQEAMGAFLELVSKAGSGELDEYLTNVTGNTGKSSILAKQMADNLKGDITNLNSIKEGLAISFGELFMGNARSTIQWLTKVIRGVNEWLKANPRLTKTLGIMAATFAGFGAVLGGIAMFGPILLAALSPVMVPIMGIATGASAIMASWDKVGNYFGNLGIDFKFLAMGITDGLKALFKGDFSGAKQAFINLKYDLRSIGGTLWQGVEFTTPKIDEMLGLKEGTSLAAMEAVWLPIKDFFIGFWAGLSGTFEPVVASFGNLWGSLKGIGESFNNLFDTIFSDTNGGGAKVFGQLMGEIAAGGLSAFGDALNLVAIGIKTLINGLDWIINFGKDAFVFFKEKDANKFNKWQQAHNDAAAAINGHVSALKELTGSRQEAMSAIANMTQAEQKSAMSDNTIKLSMADNANLDIQKQIRKNIKYKKLGVRDINERIGLTDRLNNGTLTSDELKSLLANATQYSDKGWYSKLASLADDLKQNEVQRQNLTKIQDNLRFALGENEVTQTNQPQDSLSNDIKQNQQWQQSLSNKVKNETKPHNPYVSDELNNKIKIVEVPNANTGYAKTENTENITNNTDNTKNLTTNQNINVSLTINEAQNMNANDIANATANEVAKVARQASTDAGGDL